MKRHELAIVISAALGGMGLGIVSMYTIFNNVFDIDILDPIGLNERGMSELGILAGLLTFFGGGIGGGAAGAAFGHSLIKDQRS